MSPTGTLAIPAKKRKGAGHKAKLEKLNVGEDVLLENVSVNAACCAARYTLGNGKYAVRSEPGGCRVWRKE